MQADPRPPRLARWLLRLRPLGSRRDEIAADLHEAFLERVARQGRRRAAWRYYVDVLSVWRWNPSGARVVRDAIQDLTYGARVFRRSPGTVATAIAGLALAIGVSTAVVTLLSATLFMPVGVADPASAVHVQRVWERGVQHGWPYDEYLTVREMSRDTRIEAATIVPESFRFSRTAPTLLQDESRRVRSGVVSGGYMAAFGARPLLGRILTSDDDLPGAPPVTVLGYAFWTRRMDADPAVVGQTVWLDGKAATIVGVTERRFTGVTDEPPAVWMSFTGARALRGSPALPRTSREYVSVVARIPARGTIQQAESRVGALAAALDAGKSDPYRSTGVKFVPAAEHRLPKGTGRIVGFLIGSVALVVLLACVNVASLQLAGAFARQREIGVRLALGASKARVVRQLVTESMLLGWAAGALGLAFAIWLGPVLARLVEIPITFDLAPDARVFTFLLVVSCIAGIGAGLTPARYGARGDLLTSLKGDGPRVGSSGRPGRLRGTIIGLQAAASLLLLVIASLGVRGAWRATQIEVGFDADRLIAVTGTPGGREAAKAYLEVALERVRGVNGVQAASLTDMPPFAGAIIGMNFVRGSVTHRAFLTHTDASYFSTMGLRVLRGRTFTDAEVAAAAPVAVVSESLARRLWGSEEPVGQVLDEFRQVEKAPRVTVIGVVSDTVSARLHEIRTAAIYRPVIFMNTSRILVRTAGSPEAVLPALRAALQPIHPRARPETMLVKDGLDEELRTPRRFAAIATYVAGFALALAAIGMYGVTTFVTAQRLREIGLRIAVGASPADVVRLLLRDGMTPVAIGLAAGVLVGLVASRVFEGSLYGVTARDPIAFLAAAVTLLATGALATYLPTRRAARVDPIVVLRHS